MKIAIPTNDKKNISPNFGRASYFAIYDDEVKTFDFIDNSQNKDASHGAGIQASTSVVNAGATVVIGPSFGPKAFSVLETANILIYDSNSREISLNELISNFKDNKLSRLSNPTR